MKSLVSYNFRVLPLCLAFGMAASMVLMPVQSQAQQVLPPEGTVTTQGHGEVKVRPDSLSVNVTVETKSETLASARSENNHRMQAIITALKALNLPALKLETQGVNAYPLQGEPQKNRLPKVIGYQVTNSLNVTLTGVPADSLGDNGSRIVDTALNVWATNVGGLNFFVNDMTAPRAKALELAVKDARANAQAMAKAAEIALTGVYNMEGTPQFGGYPRPMYATMRSMAKAEDASPTPVETGESTVTSDVTVRFKF
jgi:uncharacterized protein YggE